MNERDMTAAEPALRTNWAKNMCGKILRGHVCWSLPCGLALAGAVVALGTYLTPIEFVGTHVLEFSSDADEGQDELAHRIKLEKILILSRRVLDPVIADANLHRAPSLSNPQTRERELRERLTVKSVGRLLLIEYRDADPQMAAEVCNEIADSCLRVKTSSSEERQSESVRLLTPALDSWQERVKDSRQEIAEHVKSFSTSKPLKPTFISQDNAEERRDLLQDENSKLFFAREEYEQASTMVKRLNARLAISQMECRRATQEIRSVVPAFPPTVPDQPRPIPLIALASIFAFCIPTCVAIVRQSTAA